MNKEGIENLKKQINETKSLYNSFKKTLNDSVLSPKQRQEMREFAEAYANMFDKTNEELLEMLRTNEEVRKSFYQYDEIFKEKKQAIEDMNDSIAQMADEYGLVKEEIIEILPIIEQVKNIQEKINEIKAKGSNKTQEEIEREIELEANLENINKKLIDNNSYRILSNRLLDNTNNKVTILVDQYNHVNKLHKETLVQQNEAIKNFQEFKKQLDKSKGASILGNEYFDNYINGLLNNHDGSKNNLITVFKEFSGALIGAVKQSFDKWREIDQMTHDFGRKLGMTPKQLDEYRTHTIDSYEKVAKTLGMESKEIMKFQEDFTENTQRAIHLSEDQITSLVGLSRFVGDEAVNLAEQNLDVMVGGNANAAVEYLAKGMGKATKEGLALKAYSSAFAKNIKLASKYNFKDGIEGVQRMTLLTQRLKVDMASIASAMDKFSSIEGAIETGAKIQVLGGGFANNYGNPLQAMAESMLDPEAFTKRIMNTVTPLVTFDRETGEYNLSPADKMRVKAYADAIGMSYDEVFNIATQEHKKQLFNTSFNNTNITDESDINYIANKAQYNKDNKQWEIRTHTGERKEVNKLTKEELTEIRGSENTEEFIGKKIDEIHKILAKRFDDSNTFNEKVTGHLESWKLWGANIINSISSIVMWGAHIYAMSKFFGVGGAASGMWRGIKPNNSGGAVSGSSTKIGELRKKVQARGTLGKPNTLGKSAAKGAKAIGKGAGVLGSALALYDIGSALYTHSNNKDEILANQNLSKEEKKQAIAKNERNRNSEVGGALVGAGLGWAGAAKGAALGSFAGPVGTVIGGLIGGAIGYFGGDMLGKGLGSLVPTSSNDENVEEVKEQTKVAAAKNVNIDKIDHNVEIIAHSLSNYKPQSIVSSNSQLYNNQVAATNYYNKDNNSNKISFDKMKLSMDGQVKLVTDFGRSVGQFDPYTLFDNRPFMKELATVIEKEMKITKGGSSKIANGVEQKTV